MRMSRHEIFPVVLALACLSPALQSCRTAQEPSYVHMAVLKGNPYERGLEHGRLFSAEIKSLYTRLLASSILPYLNREQISIAPILKVYDGEEYRDGTFSYKMLLESGRHLYDNHIPESIKEEMWGISDGSGVNLDEIIVLNTFMDTMMAFRAVVLFIKHIQTPYVKSIEFMGGIGSDSKDNDDDGETDEEGEGVLPGLEPSTQAVMLEVPVDSSIRIVIEDAVLGGVTWPDPRNIDPLGSMDVEARCVNDDCILPECKGLDLLGRDCLNETATACLYPRLDAQCFDPDCVEAPDPGCVDQDSIRILMNDTQYVASDDCIQVRLLPLDGDETPPGRTPETNPHTLYCQGPVEVTFTPPGGLEPADEVSILLQAGDMSPIYSPTPFHARYMRDERFTFTTQGHAAGHGGDVHLYEVANRGVDDGISQPTSIAFAARGSETPDGEPILAHHFALLDSDMVHEHSALFVHVPDEGHPHALVTWTGLVWGFSGMNSEGLAYAINTSDSMDNPLVGGILSDILEPENLIKLLENPDLVGLAKVLKDRHLLATGIPAGITGRELLTGAATVDEGLDFLHGSDTTFGWNLLLVDAEGGMAIAEIDSGSQTDSEPGATVADRDGFVSYTPAAGEPGNLDCNGLLFASEGPDDLRMAAHFEKNTQDMEKQEFMGIFSPLPQRLWTRMYYRSVRAFHVLGDEIRTRSGAGIGVGQAVEILNTPELVDTRDSMNAAVYEPAAGRLHWAMGAVPATDAGFEAFDLGAVIGGVK